VRWKNFRVSSASAASCSGRADSSPACGEGGGASEEDRDNVFERETVGDGEGERERLDIADSTFLLHIINQT